MLVVHVFVQVKLDSVPAFVQATRKNAAASLLEPGVARFDVVVDATDPTRFVLVEVYKDAAAPAQHKLTTHYALWRDTVADMMLVPRTSMKYEAVFPEPGRWNTPQADVSLADTLPTGSKVPT